MEVNIANVCGLCAGCKRAISCALQEIEKGNKITIFKEIVHNKNVNDLLKNAGAKTEENLNAISNDEIVIIRAHGEPPETYKFLKEKGMTFVEQFDVAMFDPENH